MNCCRKMSAIAFVKTGQRDTLYQMAVALWKALVFGMGQIDDKAQGHGAVIFDPQDAHVTRLDQAADRVRNAGDHLLAMAGDIGSVICHQLGAEGHQLQGKGRFARAGGAEDQHPTPVDRHAAGVEVFALDCHIRPRARALCRQPHDKTRAERFGGDVGFGWANILGPDHAAVGFDDLFRNREAET